MISDKEQANWIQDIPFTIPPPSYIDSDEPWMFDKHGKENSKKSCNKCGKSLDTANSHQLCSDCIRCCVCMSKLKEYIENDGNIYCKNDFEQKFAQKCNKCQLIIKNGVQFKRALGNLFYFYFYFIILFFNSLYFQKKTNKINKVLYGI